MSRRVLTAYKVIEHSDADLALEETLNAFARDDWRLVHVLGDKLIFERLIETAQPEGEDEAVDTVRIECGCGCGDVVAVDGADFEWAAVHRPKADWFRPGHGPHKNRTEPYPAEPTAE